MYCKNSDYLFVAQQYLERHLLESTISVSGQKGKILKKEPSGTQIVSCKNAFDIFGKIPGTPQYWTTFRNELFARMEQLGPFTFFFTLSAAEMRWPEVITAIQQYENQIDKIVYKQDWELNEENIDIYSKGWKSDANKIKNLKDYKLSLKDKHKIFKDHFIIQV